MKHKPTFAVLIAVLVLVWTSVVFAHQPEAGALQYALERTVGIGAKHGKEVSAGSGVIIDEHHIITAAHVVLTKDGKKCKEIVVRVNKDLRIDKGIKIKEYNEEADWAILKVKTKLPFSDKVKVGEKPAPGDPVFATGYLWGYCSKGFKDDLCQQPLPRFGHWVFCWDEASVVDIPMVGGMSGGGIWNYKGELVSICTGIVIKLNPIQVGVAYDTLIKVLK